MVATITGHQYLQNNCWLDFHCHCQETPGRSPQAPRPRSRPLDLQAPRPLDLQVSRREWDYPLDFKSSQVLQEKVKISDLSICPEACNVCKRSPNFSDVTLVGVDDQHIQAHRVILYGGL